MKKLGEVEVTGVHFSRQKRCVLSGRMYGTGIRGVEAGRLAGKGVDPRIKVRINFYVDEGRGVFPEAGVGIFRHEVRLCNMYDAARNPVRFPSTPFNDFESAVLDAGFDGYYIEEGLTRQGIAVVLGQAAEAISTC